MDRQVEMRANLLRLGRACRGVASQTTTPVRLAPRFCLELFSFDGAEGVEHQLDDAVVLQRGQCDQLGSGGYHDPEGGMLEKIHNVGGFCTEFSCTK